MARHIDEPGILYSELLLHFVGSECPDFAPLFVEAEDAYDDADLRKPLFLKCMALAKDLSLLVGNIDEGPWAYGRKGTDDKGQPFEFKKLFRDTDGNALSFCYEKDTIVLERFFWKDDE